MHVALCLWTNLKAIAHSQLILTIIATCSPLSSICGTCLSKVSIFPSIFFTTALGTSFSVGSTLTASAPESKIQCRVSAISFSSLTFAQLTVIRILIQCEYKRVMFCSFAIIMKEVLLCFIEIGHVSV